jgi:hypothetical protein
MATAVATYLAFRRDQLDEDGEELLRGASRVEFNGTPPQLWRTGWRSRGSRGRSAGDDEVEGERRRVPHSVVRPDQNASALSSDGDASCRGRHGVTAPDRSQRCC